MQDKPEHDKFENDDPNDEENKDEENKDEENFADLLESYSPAMTNEVSVGDKIKAEIISIEKDTVFVATGTKIDGVVEKQELIDENGEFPFQKGDKLDLYVIFANENEIKLSKAISGIGGINMLKDAFSNQIPIEGKVVSQIKGGFHIEVLKRRAFCPISQIDIEYVENPEPYVGQTFQFLITQLENNAKNVVVSRRKILSQELEKSKKQFYETLIQGSVLEGKVIKIMPFGIFVRISQGVEGMVHLSEISWSRLEKPEDEIKVGQTVKVKVLGIEEGKDKRQKKISLSMKQVSIDPWEEAAQKFRSGDKVQGKVTRCMKFGAFIEIAPGIEGLAHISELSYLKRVLKPEEIVNEGDTVYVMIKEIDLHNRKIALSVKDVEGDPWALVTDRFTIGQVIKGKLEKKEKFGFFVQLEPGITGLLPISKIKKSYEPAKLEKLNENDPISVTIEEINIPARKITLAPSETEAEGDWRDFVSGSDKSLGSLGEKLQKAMKDQNK